jgi:transcriptional regulator with XRE-family HTH domain
MTDPRVARASARAVARVHRILAEDIDRLRGDAGLTVTSLARAAGVDRSYLHRVLAGTERPSHETYARLAVALGADLACRLYPDTGPLVRDRHQARMLEMLLKGLHPRWQVYPEVAVRRPSRGWIDAVLHDAREGVVVAVEIQSEFRRLEQLVRWSAEKAASLPSWDGWASLGEEPRTSSLLVVRRTRATRGTAAAFAGQLRVAYPAHPDDALAALTGTAPWPGAALIWSVIDGADARLSAGSRW